MAGDWIKIEHSLPHKPEVMQLAAILGVDELAIVGHLVLFWSWVDQNLSPECPGVIGTKSGLDRVAGKDGFATALERVGWLEWKGNEIRIPNYDQHLSTSAKQRAVESRKKQRQRALVPELSPECPGVIGTNVPEPSRPEPDKTPLREEKRREEKNREENTKTNTSVPSTNGHEIGFESFWTSFPKIRRTKKKDARSKWVAVVRKGVSPELLTAKAKEYAASPNGQSPFAVMPSTWLNGGMWDDDPVAWTSTDQIVSKRKVTFKDFGL